MEQHMKMISKIYVINLPEQTGRLKRVQALLDEEGLSIPITYIKATHWKDKEFQELLNNKTIAPSKDWEDWFVKNSATENNDPLWCENIKINQGQMACCYSHLEVLKQIRDNKETALVLQDDVYWDIPGALKQQIEDYHDLILQHSKFGIYYVGRDKVFDEEEKNYKGTKFVIPSFSWNAHAFIISHTSCNKIVDDTIYNNMIPFDEYLPTCWGTSPYTDRTYVQYTKAIEDMFPQKIDAVSSPEFTEIFQGNIDCPRYKSLATGGAFSLSDIVVSPDIGE